MRELMNAVQSDPPVEHPTERRDALELRGLTKYFRLPVLHDLTPRVRPGEFVCLLGPNGCGKTTLLRILAGLETHDSGQVLLDGAPFSARLQPAQRVGVVF